MGRRVGIQPKGARADQLATIHHFSQDVSLTLPVSVFCCFPLLRRFVGPILSPCLSFRVARHPRYDCWISFFPAVGTTLSAWYLLQDNPLTLPSSPSGLRTDFFIRFLIFSYNSQGISLDFNQLCPKVLGFSDLNNYRRHFQMVFYALCYQMGYSLWHEPTALFRRFTTLHAVSYQHTISFSC